MEKFLEDLRVAVYCNKVTHCVPDYVADGVIDEVVLEASSGFGVFADINDSKHMFNIAKKRVHDRLVNYLSGKKVSCALTGEVFKRGGIEVSLDDVDVDIAVDELDYDCVGDVDDDFPTVESLAIALSRLDAHQSKAYHNMIKDCLGACNSDVQKAFLEADARAIVLRDERRKASRRKNK